MTEKERAECCRLLSSKIVSMFGVSKKCATDAVNQSAIQMLISEDAEYISHVPLSSLAEEVHEEMFI